MEGKTTRILAAMLAVGCLAVLAIAASLEPSGEGHGTHEKLGLPACGWVQAFDRPCPTCGMTTAFAAAAHREPVRAFRTQPLGAVLCVACAGVFWGAFYAAVLGCRFDSLIRALTRPTLLWIMAAVFVLSWVYKMLTWTAAS